MANLYQLAHELETTPKELEKWLKSRGLGAGKNISSRATREARAHFMDSHDHPMASALQERDGLGSVARHEELTISESGIKVEERPHLKWGKVERSDVNVAQLDMGRQKDFFRQLRQGSDAQSSSKDQDRSAKTPSSQNTAQSVTQKTSKTSDLRSTSLKGKDRSKKRAPQSKAHPKSSRRPDLGESKNSVFGSLAPLAHQLDSVTDRPSDKTKRPDPEAEQLALQQLADGVERLAPKNSSSRKQKKRSKKSKRHKGRHTSTPPSTPSSSVAPTPHQDVIQDVTTQDITTQRDDNAQEPSFQELFERPQRQSQQSKLDALRILLGDVTRERDALRDELAKRDREFKSITAELSDPPNSLRSSSSDAQASARSQAGLIWDHLSSFGLNATQARLALFELLDHPQRGPELIYSLKHDTPQSISRGFAIVCSAEVCQEVADVNARQGLIELEERHLCSICQGSDSRGWYRRLLLTATHTQRERILVVGGDDGDHGQIKQLARHYHGINWDFIAGGTRLSQTVANAKVNHKSAVILWGGVHLPHALSNLVKASADRAGVPCFAIEPGTRSVALLCREVLRSWGVSYE